ncbi:hypothetical protein [Serratia plymuthica]|uniref:hypothetical protein n=1 Tax=Serratia plymuthica TaxID=82996 RepID=UPI001605462D|nr:hypothetical protein [Serratia plymuthica]
MSALYRPGVRFCPLRQAPSADLYAIYRERQVVQAFLDMLRAAPGGAAQGRLKVPVVP